jgi:hypothetical protein
VEKKIFKAININTKGMTQFKIFFILNEVFLFLKVIPSDVAQL